MGFSMQEYWSGLPFPSPRDLPNPDNKPISLVSPILAGRFFTTVPLGKLTQSFGNCPPKSPISLVSVGAVIGYTRTLFSVGADLSRNRDPTSTGPTGTLPWDAELETLKVEFSLSRGAGGGLNLEKVKLGSFCGQVCLCIEKVSEPEDWSWHAEGELAFWWLVNSRLYPSWALASCLPFLLLHWYVKHAKSQNIL